MNKLILFSAACALVAVLNTGCSTAGTVVTPGQGVWVEKVAGGFGFTEGPAWDGNGWIYFTDIPNNRIHRFNHSTAQLEIVKEESGGANGLAFDRYGKLIAAEGGARRLASMNADGSGEQPIAAYYGVSRLNSPNDLALDGHGGIYFTDPRYGDRSSMEMATEGVYYLDKNGHVTEVVGDLVRPNGVLLSRNRKTLYVADNAAKTIWSYPVMGAGKVGEGKVFAWMDPNAAGGGDGMTLDEKGNVYVAGQGGVWIWGYNGFLREQIHVPEAPSNVTFGGEDGSTLYITARTGLYRVKMDVRGAAWATQ